MKVSLVRLKVRCINAVLHFNLNRYLSTILILNVMEINVDLFISLLKSRSMTVVRINLRINMINSSEPSSHVFKSLVDAFSTIGKKSHSKDRNATRRVFSQSFVNKSTRALCLLKPTSKLVGLDIKAVRRYCSRREQLDFGETDVWSFVGRLRCFDMKLIDVVKGLVQEFWRDNSRPSSNQKDVIKLRMGSRDREPHFKQFLDMTQTELYERFRHEHNELDLGQRSFEKCKPWYVKMKTTRNTCCC